MSLPDFLEEGERDFCIEVSDQKRKTIYKFP